jgi:hypothetical protein
MQDGKEVLLWCPDCAEAGMDIYLWERPGPDRGRVLAAFGHGTRARAIGKEFSREEGRHYHLVEAGGRRGFVPPTLVKEL